MNNDSELNFDNLLCTTDNSKAHLNSSCLDEIHFPAQLSCADDDVIPQVHLHCHAHTCSTCVSRQGAIWAALHESSQCKCRRGMLSCMQRCSQEGIQTFSGGYKWCGWAYRRMQLCDKVAHKVIFGILQKGHACNQVCTCVHADLRGMEHHQNYF